MQCMLFNYEMLKWNLIFERGSNYIVMKAAKNGIYKKLDDMILDHPQMWLRILLRLLIFIVLFSPTTSDSSTFGTRYGSR